MAKTNSQKKKIENSPVFLIYETFKNIAKVGVRFEGKTVC
jgi:hypothetical protein